jgi:hypothetical protein
MLGTSNQGLERDTECSIVRFLFLLVITTYLIQFHRRKGPLENHIATVAEFLQTYRAADAANKSRVFHAATCYIIASCWRKMF